MKNISVSEYVSQFKEWRKSDKKGEVDWMQGWEEERKDRRAWYLEKLSEGVIDNLSEKDFSRLIKELWATGIWSNKDYKVNKLIEDNSLPKLKKNLKHLIYGSDSLEKRWDSFRNEIKGLGPSSMSEILAFSDPDKYGIVNLKPLSLLPVLGVLSESEFKKYSYYSIDGRRYVNLLGYLSKVRDVLQKNGLEKADFIDTDFFIAYLFYNVFNLYKQRDKETKVEEMLGKTEKPKESVTISLPILDAKGVKISTHQEAQSVLLRLGKLLGYDTYTPNKSWEAYGKPLTEYATLKDLPPFTHEDYLRTVKEIDVIWLEDDFPVICFEVEHTTGVASGLLRLYQVRKFNTGLYIVAPKEVENKFQTEVNKDPFRQTKERFVFRSYGELEKFYTLAKSYHAIKESFLVK